MYVDELQLNDFRAISTANVRFVHPLSPTTDSVDLTNMNLLVGANGGGKSTLLKAIASAYIGDPPTLDDLTASSIRNWHRLGGRGPHVVSLTYRVDLDQVGTGQGQNGRVGQARLRLRPGQLPETENRSLSKSSAEQGLLYAYGSQRFTGEPGGSHSADDIKTRVQNLFEVSPTLRPPEPMLERLSEDDLVAVNSLMPPDTTLTGSVAEDGLARVVSRGVEVDRAMLSDGAQSYMAWVLDLISRLDDVKGTGSLFDVRATVLVDEVDQRMHPSWQQVVLRRLALGLPNIHGLCSAHSALLAGGLRPNNLVVLYPDLDAPGEGAMTARHIVEDVYGRTADRVLTSSYFQLSMSRSDVFQADLRTLAGDAARTRGQEGQPVGDDAALRFIQALANRPETT